MAKIVIENVCKAYLSDKGEEMLAVDNVNLVIEDREFVILVGSSGCGKSTTLRMIAGLEEITKGNIFINDKRINEVPPKDRDLAMVFQNYALYPHMTVYKNMAFGLQLRNYPRAEIENRVRDAAQILGFTDEMLQRKPKALSGGQRQRVALGRAIVRKPSAFLLDEPLSNLDAKMRVQMRLEISQLQQRLACTMVYVTHDQVEAMTMADRIVVMKGGRIQQVAVPLDLYHNPCNAYVASFIGSPAMNLIEGTIETFRSGLGFFADHRKPDGVPAKLQLTEEQAGKLSVFVGKPVIFGIRPEALQKRVSSSPADSEDVLSGSVEVVEPMGADTFLHLNVGGDVLVARFQDIAREKVGDRITIQVDMAKGYFFERRNPNDFQKRGTAEIDMESWHAECKRVA
jgi:multiple sugar transport system ATP-binding protein